MTDLLNVMADYERRRQAQAKLNEGNKGTVFDALASAGITEVRIDFDGEGDSGQINGVAPFRGEEAAELPKTPVAFQTISWQSDQVVTTEHRLEEAIETLCYSYLDQTHGGWENNEGGYGEFVFDVAKRIVELEFNGRFIETYSDAHSF